MIHLYEGVPGSGKSLKACGQIIDYARAGKPVICNFPVTFGAFGKQRDRMTSSIVGVDLTPAALVAYSKEYFANRKQKERQILLVIDEAETVFSSRRGGQDALRIEWIKFFSLHRKLGFEVILICPSKKMIDEQIYRCCELIWNFRCATAFLPFFLQPIIPKIFACIALYQGDRGLKTNAVHRVMFSYHKKWGSIYDTYALFGQA